MMMMHASTATANAPAFQSLAHQSATTTTTEKARSIQRFFFFLFFSALLKLFDAVSTTTTTTTTTTKTTKREKKTNNSFASKSACLRSLACVFVSCIYICVRVVVRGFWIEKGIKNK